MLELAGCSFLLYLHTSYPGSELLGSFEKELAKHEKSRQELANAEKLFDLPITMYPELIKVQKEMGGLRMIYDLYDSLKVQSLAGDSPGWAQGTYALGRGLVSGGAQKVDGPFLFGLFKSEEPRGARA